MGLNPIFSSMLVGIMLLCLIGCGAHTTGRAINPTSGAASISPPTFTFSPSPAQGYTDSPDLTIPAPQASKQPAPTQPSLKVPTMTQPELKPGAQAYLHPIGMAIDDLAARLGLATQAIQFIGVSSDEFPADNLGCLGPGLTPRPIPAIVSGQVIILEVQGRRYTYHARKASVVFCGPWD